MFLCLPQLGKGHYFMAKGHIENTNDRIYYVYAWYIKSTNEVFHVGKGKNNRYLDIRTHRNQYFINIVSKHKDDVDVRILQENLTNDEALKLEKETIAKYKKLGQCKTNIHEGGCGGNTGKYDDPERSRKLSIAASKRTGERNSMYGKHHSEKTKKILHDKNIGKKISEEHRQKLIAANTGRKKSKKELEDISKRFKGIPKSKEQYEKMMDKDCPYHYFVKLNGNIIFDSISSKKLEDFCNNVLHISRTIMVKVGAKCWKPKFKNINGLKLQRFTEY